jgi:hypothetical protein
MVKHNYITLAAPIFLIIAILAIWLSLTYLPLSEWGLTIPTNDLWLYMPWIIVFALALYVLKTLYRRH